MKKAVILFLVTLVSCFCFGSVLGSDSGSGNSTSTTSNETGTGANSSTINSQSESDPVTPTAKRLGVLSVTTNSPPQSSSPVVLYKCAVSNSISSSSSNGSGSSQTNVTNSSQQDFFDVPPFLVRETSSTSSTTNSSKPILHLLQFRLESKDLFCPNGQFQHGLPSSEAEMYYYFSPKQQPQLQNQLTYFSEDGYLTIDSNLYHPNEYCVNRVNGSGTGFSDQQQHQKTTITVCNPNCTVKTPCIAKCCDLNEYWNADTKSCIVIPENMTLKRNQSVTTNYSHVPYWGPEFYVPNEIDCLDDFDVDFIHFVKSLPNCTDGDLPLIYYHSDQSFRVLGNGTVTGRIPPANWKPLKNEGFCIDKTLSRTLDGGMQFEQIMLACPGQVNTMRVKDAIAPIYLAILFSSALVLLLTALIYLILWKTQNLHGWCIFCEVISMFLMILCVTIAHSLARNPDAGDYGSLHCVVIGASAHFFFLSTFFWLTVINADLWWNFRKMSPVNKSITNHSYRRFFLYLFLSEIGPAIIITIGLLLDEKYGLKNGGLDCSEVIVPNYGQTNCYLSKPSQGPYLFYPIGVLLGCNLVFFLMTIFSMWEYQKGTQAILRGKSTNQTQSFTVVAKLFIVMGVSWVLEILAWVLNQPKNKDPGSYVPSYWIVFDFVSLLQALSIFVIFICRQTVLTKLMRKFPCLQKVWNLFPKPPPTRRPSSQRPSTANVMPSGDGTGVRQSISRNTISTSPSDTMRLARMHSKTSTLSTSIA